VANSFLNNVNQNTPQGSLTYDVTGNYSWQDPSTGQTYNIPRFTSNQTLSPSGQALQNTTDQTKQALANTALSQTNRVGGLLSTPFDPNSGAPAGGSAAGIMGAPKAQLSYDMGGPIQRSLAGADDYGADRERVEAALYGRLNPQLQRERGNIEQRLADQGIRYGSQAYSSAMDDYNRQANDARLAVTAQGGEEQQRLFNMGLGAGSFANAAQAQQNAQNAASFYNTGAQQQLGQQQSGFNASNAARNQWMQEQYQQRNQPLNEIAALMSGSQVQQPNWLNSPQSQIATTDIGGLINQNFAQQQGNYQTAMNSWNSTMGGLLGLGAGIAKSDERAKQNIVPMGSVFAADAKGERKELPVYEWEYKRGEGDRGRHVGPMAQDVEKIDRGAVKTIDGRKHIDTQRVMGSILRAA